MLLSKKLEKMSSENRERIYQKCRDAKLQFIATRTTDSPELEVHYLEEK